MDGVVTENPRVHCPRVVVVEGQMVTTDDQLLTLAVVVIQVATADDQQPIQKEKTWW